MEHHNFVSAITGFSKRSRLSSRHDSCTLISVVHPIVVIPDGRKVGTWLSLVERTLGVGEVASSNLVVPTIPSNEPL